MELDHLAKRVIGAAIEVHRVLVPGFLESIYEEALSIGLSTRQLRFARQVAIDLQYKGRQVGEGRLDLLIENQLVVELKAVDTLAPIHTAQVLSYLKATNRSLGLLINFNVPMLRDGIRRVVLS
jgi:GxxExxY protein